MKYAIFSDIHGNFPAFAAALSDAGKQGAGMFLMLGDYTGTFPWPNEVVETIRGIGSAAVIRGNGEGYLINLQKQNQDEWVHEQFKPLYWNYRALKPDNLEYLTALPEIADISDNGGNIRLAHSLEIFYRSPKINIFHSNYFRKMMETAPFSHEEYLALAREALLSRDDALAEINDLPKGIYLLGHNHLQFYMEYGDKIFINPGSCGGACDCDTSAAYTILECVGNDWEITERRVKYNVELTAEGVRNSGLAAESPVWNGIIERQLITGKDYFGEFVGHLISTSRELGQTEYPVNNDVWDAAVKTWKI